MFHISSFIIIFHLLSCIFHLSFYIFNRSSFIYHLSPFIFHFTFVIFRLSSFILHFPSFVLHLSFYIVHLSSFIFHTSSFILTSFILYFPSIVLQLSSITFHLSISELVSFPTGPKHNLVVKIKMSNISLLYSFASWRSSFVLVVRIVLTQTHYFKCIRWRIIINDACLCRCCNLRQIYVRRVAECCVQRIPHV